MNLKFWTWFRKPKYPERPTISKGTFTAPAGGYYKFQYGKPIYLDDNKVYDVKMRGDDFTRPYLEPEKAEDL